MKKILAFLAVIVSMSLFLSACDFELFLTSDYRKFDNLYNKIQDGKNISKEEVFDILGYPHCYFSNDDENWQYYTYDNKESFEENLFRADANEWVYECWKYQDPADPYRLNISFDEEGKVTDASFEVIPGG
ncbi:MAG: outer membrane protein assembly factor BamE [Lachnospiraceae bacterium]|nr:outer membrane protein assembly factor BamE [Lachnospiraceae bacterium]